MVEWDRRAQESINITEYNTPEHYDNIRQYSATAEKLYSEFLLTQLVNVVDLRRSKSETEQTITDISNNIKDIIIRYDDEFAFKSLFINSGKETIILFAFLLLF